MTNYFIIFATDKCGLLEQRTLTRPKHQYYLRNHSLEGLVVVHGGPTLSEKNNTMNGTLLIVEAINLEQVQEFIKNDPYYQAGIFESLDIRPWAWGIGKPVNSD
jgi:uncharacterized protein YciI